jgi:hypothetical protein
MKAFFVLVFAFVLLTIFGCIKNTNISNNAEARCSVNEKLINVSLVKDIEKPIYKFKIQNNYKSDITSFSLGDSHYNQIYIMPKYIPKAIESPDGWVGFVVYGHESPYMSFFWRSNTPDKTIKFSTFLEGFVLEMGSHEDLIRDLKYTVIFQDGNCASGDTRVSR